MRRKVLKRGHCTARVSLPRSWIRHNQVEFGDFLDLHVTDDEIRISKKKEERPLIIDVGKLGVWRIHFFSQIYQKGITRVRFINITRAQKNEIKERLWNFPFAEVTRDDDILEVCIHDSSSHYSSFLKKMFEITFDSMDSIISGKVDSDDASLREAYALGELVNRKINLDVPEIDKYYLQAIPTWLIFINRGLHDVQKGLMKNKPLSEDLKKIMETMKKFLLLYYDNTYRGMPLDLEKHSVYRNELFHRLRDDPGLFERVDNVYVAEKVFYTARLVTHLCCRNLLFPRFFKILDENNKNTSC